MTDYEIDYEKYIPLVKRIALNLHKMLPVEFEFDDLLQTGMVALVDCVHSYGPKVGMPVDAYVGCTVKRRLLDYIRDSGVQSRSFAGFSRSLFKAEGRLFAIFGRKPTDKELAEELGMTVDDLHSRYTEANWMSFVTLSDNDNMEQLCTNAELVTDQINKEQLLKIIGSSIKHLSEQEQLVLSLYYNEELNLREIKAILDLTEARIHQIKGGALVKLKGFILNEK
ncbi:sigma-70 family RNA polymerase sigma factor [Pseudoalteromonas marina]|uniref:Sigma-70 family RNA polymerase sigma factor n=2 Tax=Bacteria TaxID=2 RepID=A0ABT9FC17_9GAMM|nr:sigma-70 family RNA polymerase sigma factor [Pseudoalteromonas marina]MDP2564322.1 sigma-70 family RNA polymerase sigma factor [Pseudoalteromonas marina]